MPSDDREKPVPVQPLRRCIMCERPALADGFCPDAATCVPVEDAYPFDPAVFHCTDDGCDAVHRVWRWHGAVVVSGATAQSRRCLLCGSPVELVTVRSVDDVGDNTGGRRGDL